MNPNNFYDYGGAKGKSFWDASERADFIYLFTGRNATAAATPRYITSACASTHHRVSPPHQKSITSILSLTGEAAQQWEQPLAHSHIGSSSISSRNSRKSIGREKPMPPAHRPLSQRWQEADELAADLLKLPAMTSSCIYWRKPLCTAVSAAAAYVTSATRCLCLQSWLSELYFYRDTSVLDLSR